MKKYNVIVILNKEMTKVLICKLEEAYKESREETNIQKSNIEYIKWYVALN